MNASLQRDGTVEWAQPGVFEVVPGVYRIPLPLPNDGLKAVNVYAINTDEDVVLIDSGWAIAKARSTASARAAISPVRVDRASGSGRAISAMGVSRKPT